MNTCVKNILKRTVFSNDSEFCSLIFFQKSFYRSGHITLKRRIHLLSCGVTPYQAGFKRCHAGSCGIMRVDDNLLNVPSPGLDHYNSDGRSIMYNKPTAHNVDYFFDNVFREFDGTKLFKADRDMLAALFLEPEDRSKWNDRSSQLKKTWSSLVDEEHPECKIWNAKKVKTVSSYKPDQKLVYSPFESGKIYVNEIGENGPEENSKEYELPYKCDPGSELPYLVYSRDASV